MAGTNPSGYVGPEFVVARLTSSGALDATFGPNGRGYDDTTLSPGSVNDDKVDALGVDASGNLLLGGTWYNASASTWSDQVVRYTPAGLIDTTFANNGIDDLSFGSALDGIEGIGFQSNGQIVLGFINVLDPTTGLGGVTRLNPNGTLDSTFGSNGYFTDPIGGGAVEIAVQPNDEILLETFLNTPGSGILVDRLLTGGSLDPVFGTGGRVEFSNNGWGPAEGIVVGADGKITGTALNGNTPAGSATFRLLGDPTVTSQLVVTQQPPPSLSAGSPFGLTVDVDDSSGNLETSFDGTVSVAIANGPPGAALGGTLTVTATQGVATFSGLTLTTAASNYTLLVTGSSLGEAVTSAIAVSPLSAAQLVITQQPPTSSTAGSSFGVQAAIEDVYGNVETADNSDVATAALASNPTGATLDGTLAVTVSQGIGTFSGLTLTEAAAGYTIGISTGTFGATTGAITVSPASATQLVITQQPPSSVVVNKSFGLQAAIEDAYGNVVTSASNTVKVAIDTGPSGAKLGGTLSAKASQGVAKFSGLTLNKVGAGYTLQLTSSGLTSVITSAITVTSNSPNVVPATPPATSAFDPLLAPLVLDSPGLWDGLAVKKRDRTI